MSSVADGCVVDASTVLTAFADEPLAQRAQAFLSLLETEPAGSWAVPELFDIECASGLVKMVRRGAVAADRLAASLAKVVALPLWRVTMQAVVPRAVELALERPLSVYDASYVAVAEKLGVPLVTADGRLVRALEGGGYPVVALADVEL